MSCSPMAPGTALNDAVVAVWASAAGLISRLPPVTPIAAPTASANTMVAVLFIAVLPSPACAGHVASSVALKPMALLLSLVKIAQIRRLLSLFHGHQEAVGGHEVALLADEDVLVVLSTVIEVPHNVGAGLTHVALGYCPGPRQCMVDGGDLVDQHVLVGLVEVDALLEDALSVIVQANAARLVGAWALETASLDLERGIAAACVRIDPLADRETVEGRLNLLRPFASISKD